MAFPVISAPSPRADSILKGNDDKRFFVDEHSGDHVVLTTAVFRMDRDRRAKRTHCGVLKGGELEQRFFAESR